MDEDANFLKGKRTEVVFRCRRCGKMAIYRTSALSSSGKRQESVRETPNEQDKMVPTHILYNMVHRIPSLLG